MPIENVFVPLDFSESSRAALALVRGLGHPPPRVQLSHILEAWTPHTREVFFPYAALGEDAAALDLELCDSARARLASYFSLDDLPKRAQLDSPIVRVGRTKEELPEVLRSVDADLVVMGAFGETGAMPGALGATAARVLQTATQPVLLTRGYDPAPRISRVLCAVDLEQTSHEVVAAALEVALMAEADLELLFVLPDPLADDPNGLLRGSVKFDEKRTLGRERATIEALFDRTVAKIEPAFADKERARALLSRRSTHVGRPSATILERAHATDADLIVVGSRSLREVAHHQLGSTAWAVTRSCHVHVMVVPLQHDANLLEQPD